MKGQLLFAMHPDDEAQFLERLFREPGLALVRGFRWATHEPPVVEVAGDEPELWIWNRSEVPNLGAQFVPETREWYCTGGHHMIQLVRSRIVDGSVLTVGRLAVGSTDVAVGKRFRALTKSLKSSYRNDRVGWQSPRSISAPSKPAPDLWVGPAALQWLDNSPNRCVQQEGATVRGMLVG